jgi:haloalkane dehalogenase
MTASDPHARKRVAVLDTEMSYVDVGDDIGRCLAPDLVGMG